MFFHGAAGRRGRLVAGTSRLDLRRDLYARMRRLPVSFHVTGGPAASSCRA